MLYVDVFCELLEWGLVQIWKSGSSDPVGFVRSPWLVVSVFLHIFLSNSLFLSFGDSLSLKKKGDGG
jgi:hypothetical protein